MVYGENNLITAEIYPNEEYKDEQGITDCKEALQQIIDQVVLPTRPTSQWPLVVGFSDITALHALMSLHGVPSLHASMCKALATLPDDAHALSLLRDVLEGKLHLEEVIGEGRNIIGGNLSVLYGLQGTPYSLNKIIEQCKEAPILFIEDISENHYHIDRMLQNLRLSGVFEKISGLVVGQFTDCADDVSMGCSLLESIRQIAEPYSFPILFDYPSGHIDSNYPLLFSQEYYLSITNF